MSEKRKDIRKTISPIIGSKLKDLRTSSDLSIEVLAEKIGLSKSMISYIESAKRLPSVRLVKIYAGFFGVDVLDLLDLREQTIFETVAMLGEDAPLAIRNERNMIAHSYKREDRFPSHLPDMVEEEKGLYIQVKELNPMRAYDRVISVQEEASRKASTRNRRAEEKAKIERSIYEIDDIEVTDEEFQIAVEAVRAFRRQNDSTFE